MFKRALPLFMLSETPIHVGSGTDLGVIDLPIQREKHTNYPKIESSGVKGCIREDFEQLKNGGKLRYKGKFIEEKSGQNYINYVFGPEKGDSHAGAMGFTDGRVLLFPVKSVRGIFAWITCPHVIERFVRDIHLCEIIGQEKFNVPDISHLLEIQEGDAITTTTSNLIIKSQKGDKIMLEEYAFNAKAEELLTLFANFLVNTIVPDKKEFDIYRQRLVNNLLILPNDDFKDFVSLSTEVVARTKIDIETGTVKTGALWYEENVPADTIFYNIIMSAPIFVPKENKTEKVLLFDENPETEAENIIGFFAENISDVLQIGGNSTIGRGLVYTKLARGELDEK